MRCGTRFTDLLVPSHFFVWKSVAEKVDRLEGNRGNCLGAGEWCQDCLFGLLGQRQQQVVVGVRRRVLIHQEQKV